VRLAVRVTPKGGRDAIEGWTTDAAGRPLLNLRVSAVPAEGAANAAVIALLAKALGRPKSGLAIVRGEAARVKQVEIPDLGADELARTFGTPPS
jgi:uncharacterized protein YggU (UPF0235/DUF167 family)